ncbi:glutathione S-transferase 2-like [Melitaea cinxia]|uniref:glutathione S-transferase 2-like n=1 Tax=Melitaea cinxia TaxID=113334 RepID=UPI001E26EAE4|nr:glutathione S-transferase 2-like [Melitaea cinxia]XP_045451321.1 glutathione S-transferase 2-like [Melitaea cinxia]XP_045451322.1 glutathione S-transferase 2-like [Melitaea cinxia]
MPEVKVYYFQVKAVGEPIRLLLAYGGQEFQDIRLSKADWPALKPTMPFGQMPVLEIDGKKYAQSTAIERYLGRKYELAGKDIEEDFEIDQVMDFFTDIRLRAAAVFKESDEAHKAKMQKENETNHYPGMLKKLNEIIIENNGHLALGRLTWADFVFAGMYDCLKVLVQISDIDEQYPSFKKLQESVLSIPKVKAFCDQAPKADW